MATGLLNSSGTDFESLFEQGGGNQLLGIYALDGQDIGQKFLNVSEGSAISANTGFQVADGSDVRTKLCAKGTNKAGVSYKVYQWQTSRTSGSGEDEYTEYRPGVSIQITTTKSCTINGEFSYTYWHSSTNRAGTDYGIRTVTHTFTKTISSTGTYDLLIGPWGGDHSGTGAPRGFSGTITCGSFSASFSTSAPSGSF